MKKHGQEKRRVWRKLHLAVDASTHEVNGLYVDPHAQAFWSDVDADGFRESNGTRVSGTGNDNVQLKLGVRTYLNGKSRLDRDTVREFQPFVEANWIYNTREYGVRMNDDSFRVSGERNVGELKTGVEARLGQRVGYGGTADRRRRLFRHHRLAGYKVQLLILTRAT